MYHEKYAFGPEPCLITYWFQSLEIRGAQGLYYPAQWFEENQLGDKVI